MFNDYPWDHCALASTPFRSHSLQFCQLRFLIRFVLARSAATMSFLNSFAYRLPLRILPVIIRVPVDSAPFLFLFSTMVSFLSYPRRFVISSFFSALNYGKNVPEFDSEYDFPLSLSTSSPPFLFLFWKNRGRAKGTRTRYAMHERIPFSFIDAAKNNESNGAALSTWLNVIEPASLFHYESSWMAYLRVQG